MPVWRYTVDLSEVFHDERLTFEQRRDEIVRIIRESEWFAEKVHDQHETLPLLVADLADASDIGLFDEVWNDVYDWADIDRAWIKTH